jgi:hypothetical protein
MVRKQIYIEPRQDKALKKLARKTGMTEAEIIRTALEAHIDELARQQQRKAAWEKVDSFIDQLIAKGPVPGGRTWRREDLYDRPRRWNR